MILADVLPADAITTNALIVGFGAVIVVMQVFDRLYRKKGDQDPAAQQHASDMTLIKAGINGLNIAVVECKVRLDAQNAKVEEHHVSNVSAIHTVHERIDKVDAVLRGHGRDVGVIGEADKLGERLDTILNRLDKLEGSVDRLWREGVPTKPWDGEERRSEPRDK